MISKELSTAFQTIQPKLAPSQTQLIATAALALAFVPAAVVSMLPQTQFAETMPTSLAVLLALIGFAWLVRRNPFLRTERWVALLVFAIFALRLCGALAIGRWWWWPQTLTAQGNDWDIYEMLGWDLAQLALSFEALGSYPLNEVGVVYLVGVLYSIVGRNPLVLTVFFTFLGAWIALDVAEIVTLTAGRKAGARAVMVASVLPASVFYGALPAKDILVTLSFVKLILLFLRSQRQPGWNVRTVAMTSGLVFIIGMVRATAIPILVISFAGLFAFVAPRARRRLIALTVVLALVGAATVAWRLSEVGGIINLSPIAISQFVYGRTGGESATLSEIGLIFITDETSSIAVRTFWDGDVARAYLIPLRALLLLFVPFPPVYFSTLDNAMESLNALVVLLLAPAMLAAFVYHDRGCRMALRELSWLWCPLAVNVFVVGAALPFIQPRYSLLSQFLFVGLAAVGMRYGKRLATLYLLLPFSLLVVVLLYIYIKSS